MSSLASLDGGVVASTDLPATFGLSNRCGRNGLSIARDKTYSMASSNASFAEIWYDFPQLSQDIGEVVSYTLEVSW